MKAILISGAGIAGPTLAFWLKAAGFEPTLVERAPALRRGGYVIDFWGLGYDIAERMGLIAEVNRVGYHAREMRIVDDRGHSVAGFGTRVFAELTSGRYVTLARSDLSRLLFERLKGTVEVIFDDEIVGLEERSDGVRVQLRQAGERQFDLVVGADGLHSVVRKLAFGPQQRFEKDLGYIVAAFEAGGYRPRDAEVYLMYGQPGRMVGRFTLRDDRTLFLFVFASADDPLPAALDRQKHMLRRQYAAGKWECPAILAELDRAAEVYFDRVSQIRMTDWSKGRIVLLGDAAFCVSLLAGQGSALAMISAYVLAGELAAAGGQYRQALDNYEARLRSFIETKQRGAERFAGALAPKTRWGLGFRNQMVKAFSIPGFARLVIGREIIDTLRLPEYDFRSFPRD
ncbi:MAG: FAD-binding domain [Bradyrhizobium sp.]|uniref:FAD-binding domain n=1 Tax=Bradyrhizobium sp. TaxID=376 RepID=UPI002393B25D|nr:FAD-binding domain [Bradyrhizobium sp.]MDE2602504.1 FAD-binding domain [Bradyrhizobium sp.]